ncbi:MAG TPA: SDR family oxidoreductase [Acidimicrobiales bacterium]|jgi:NAD(P)-dependent dehydrogenase (short-subunit alcohol dehydrogenase family)|nr:SDR family oxidoreductase [Acidimicrobiales bacterium]
MVGRLDGEVAIVTGSTAGLGQEVAALFAAEGGRVVVTGRNEERGEAVAADLRSRGGDVRFRRADLTDEGQARELVRSTEAAFGAVTVLVNNAVSPEVIAADGKLADVPNDVWHAMYHVNVLGAVWLMQEAIPAMQRSGHGSIVNVSSRTAERASPRLAAYTASKGAMNALARSITLDYARTGIRCNTVQPGYILHAERDANLTTERRRYIEDMCLTRPPTARDVAYAVLFFASREAECISGVTLQVDAGSSAARARTFDYPPAD